MNEQNHGELHNQEDVNPGSELEKMVNGDAEEQLPSTNGTGSNNPVPRQESLIITDESAEEESDEDDIA